MIVKAGEIFQTQPDVVGERSNANPFVYKHTVRTQINLIAIGATVAIETLNLLVAIILKVPFIQLLNTLRIHPK